MVDNQASSQHHDWNIFYHKHKILRDEKTGDFDRDKAEELLVKEAEISEKTGNQGLSMSAAVGLKRLGNL